MSMGQVIESIEREAFERATKTIERGFCIVVRESYATVVPFTTISCERATDTVPLYRVRLQSGEIEEYNETELLFSKDEQEEMCKKFNNRMAKNRKMWCKEKQKLLYADKLTEHRCSCGRLIGRFSGQAEVKCPKCGKMNVIGVENHADSGIAR